MGFVDKINETLNKGVSETERMLEIGKLKTKVTTLNRDRQELLTALGAVAYDQWRNGASDLAAFGPLGEKVRATELEITQTRNRLDELENVKVAGRIACPACGGANTHGAAFCVACGTAMPVPVTGPACASCGATLPDGGKFCIRCGTPVATPAEVEESADVAADDQGEQA